VFGLVFVGFNVAFLPMHLTGLLGMPRRVYTYAPEMGWDALNLVSTVGAFTIAAGVALLVIDLARRFRMSAEGNAGNVWGAGTLEWLPTGNYSSRSIPIVASREPLWDQANLAATWRRAFAGSGQWRARDVATSAIDAKPQWVLRMPMPGWAPLVAAWFTAAFFLLLTFKLVVPAAACGAVAIAALLHWAWELDPPADLPPVDIGGDLRLPVYASGPLSQAWWAMVILMLVAAALYGCLLFSYLYLWTVSPDQWVRTDVPVPVSADGRGRAPRGERRRDARAAHACQRGIAIRSCSPCRSSPPRPAVSLAAHRDLAPADSATARSSMRCSPWTRSSPRPRSSSSCLRSRGRPRGASTARGG
jgi:cytochrome c oxidase subunit I+III